MIGVPRLPSMWASATEPSSAPSLATHWIAPPGLRVCTHSWLKRLLRYRCVQRVGACVQAPSRPLVTVSAPDPAAAAVLPAQTLRLGAGRRRLDVHAVVRLVRAVHLAKGVAAGDQGHGFLVVHGHAAKALADLLRRGQRVRHAGRAFGVHVDQAHLRGAHAFAQVALRVVAVTAQHLRFRAPVHQLGLPVIAAPAGKAEGLEAHVLHGHGAGQHHQIGPGDLPAIFLLQRPQQAPGLVQVGVVRPAVQRVKAHLPATPRRRGRQRCGRCRRCAKPCG